MHGIGRAKVFLRDEANGKDFVLKNGRIINPKDKTDKICDIAVSGGKIAAIGETGESFAQARSIDLSGYLIFPGMMDLHTNLREP